MYVYMCSTAVKELPKDDQDRSNHVGVMTIFYTRKYNFSITAFVGFIVWIVY